MQTKTRTNESKRSLKSKWHEKVNSQHKYIHNCVANIMEMVTTTAVRSPPPPPPITIYIYQIIFFLPNRKRCIFNIHFNIILKLIYTKFNCSVCSQEYSATHSFCTCTHTHTHTHTHTRTNLCFQITSINSNTLPNTPDVQPSAVNTLRYNNKPDTILDHNWSTEM
jgi:hypothetical protein